MTKFKKLASHFRRGLTRISPKLNTQITYRIKFHKRLNLRNPKTLNEKNLWLKLYNYNSNAIVKQCADKYAVRNYVKECGLDYLLNELIAVYNDPEQIEWDALPTSFAIKLNVGCGFNHIIRNKSSEDFEQIKKEVKQWIKESKTQYLEYSELQYKDVPTCILIEKLIGDPLSCELPMDYKVYCFNGNAKYILICTGRENSGHPKFYFFDTKWNLCRINKDGINAPKDLKIEEPCCLDELLHAAEILSSPFPFVRVDFYVNNGKPIFGELTFTPSGGMDTDRLYETDLMFGEMLAL